MGAQIHRMTPLMLGRAKALEEFALDVIQKPRHQPHSQPDRGERPEEGGLSDAPGGFGQGEVSRGAVIASSGLKERTGRTLLGQLLIEGLLLANTPKGDVRLGLPIHASGWFPPGLYPPLVPVSPAEDARMITW